MIKILTALVKMQHLDDLITEKETLKKRIPLQLEELEKNVSEAQSAVDDVKKSLDKILKDKDKSELEVKANNEQIVKYDTQLTSIKTNKEYKALTDEINFIKEKNSVLEDKLLTLLEQEQEKRDILAEKKIHLKEREKDLESKADDLKRSIVAVEQEIENAKERRKEIAKKIPIQIVKRYANLIKHKNRKAVVFINSSTGCGGCGFSIRPQLLIDITKKDSIVSCESCGRMIISKEVEEYVENEENK